MPLPLDPSTPSSGLSNDALMERLRASARVTADNISVFKEQIKQSHRDNAARILAEDKAKESLTSKFGLDINSGLGATVNLFANAKSGSFRAVGDMATTLPDAEAMRLELSQPAENIAARNRFLKGMATPDDVALINKSIPAQNNYAGMPSTMEAMSAAKALREDAAAINNAFDRSSDVNSVNKDKLAKDLGKDFESAWDMTKAGWNGGNINTALLKAGVGALGVNALKALPDNKMGAAEYIAENVPQLLIGGLKKGGRELLGLSNAGYGIENYREGVLKNEKENQGTSPELSDLRTMAAAGVGSAALENLTDISLLKAMKAKEGVKIGLGKSLQNTAEATATGVGKESFTEAAQTKLEGIANLTPATAEQIYTSGVIGGIVGGGMSGAGRAFSEATKSTPEHAAERKVTADAEATLTKHMETNNADAYLDKTKPAEYNPVNAVRVLLGHVNTQAATPEVQEANMTKAGEIVSTMEAERDTLKQDASRFTPEGKSAIQDKITSYQDRLTKVDPTDTATVAKLNSAIEMTTLQLKNSNNKQLASDAQVALNKSDRELTTAQELLSELNTATSDNVTAEDVKLHIDTGNSTAPEARASLDTVINLSMRNSDKLTPEDAIKLADNKDNALTKDERAHLRVFSEARILQNQLSNMDKVSQEVYSGAKATKDKPKHEGIATWQVMSAAAIASGNKSIADRALTGLTKFAESHAGKAVAAKEARRLFGLEYNASEKANPTRDTKATEARKKEFYRQIVKAKDGTWSVLSGDKRLPLKELEKHGQEIRSLDLVNNIGIESQALNAAVAEMKSAQALKFGVQSVSSAKQTSLPENINTVTTTDDTSRLKIDTTATPAKPKVDTRVRPTKSDATKKTPVFKTEPEARAYIKDTDGFSPNTHTSKLTGKGYEIIPKPVSTPAVAPVISEDKSKFDPRYLSRVSDYFNNPPPPTPTSTGYTTENALRHITRLESMLPTVTEEHAYDLNAAIKKGKEITQADKHAAPDLEPQDVKQEAAKQPDVAIAESPVAAAATAETNTDTVIGQTSDGDTLGLSSKKTPKDTIIEFKKRNVVADFFTQEAGSETGTQRPLVLVDNFLEKLDTDTSTLFDYLPDTTNELTEEQSLAVDTFISLAQEWVTTITGNMVKGHIDTRHKNYIQYLLDGLGNLPTNVATAMSAAVFTYVGENGSSSLENTPKEINAILFRDEDTSVTDNESNVLSNIGSRESSLINSIGQRIVQSLGLRAIKDANANMMSMLAESLGSHAVKLMVDQKLMTRTTISGEAMSSLLNSDLKYPGVKFHFLNFAAKKDGTVSNNVLDIVDANKGSKSIVNKLFDIESTVSAPSFEPVKHEQKTVAGGTQLTPNSENKILDNNGKKANHVSENMASLLPVVSEDFILEAAGADLSAESDIQKSQRKGVAGKLAGLKRELTNLKKFLYEDLAGHDLGFKAPIFFKFSIWKQHRVGISTTLINPQTSKIVRAFLTRDTWNTTIDFSDVAANLNFNLRVAEGLGIKNDKIEQKLALVQFASLMGSKEIKGAVKVLRQTLNDRETPLTPNQEAVLLAGVKKGGEGMHSLSALMALAVRTEAMEKAKTDPTITSFTSELMAEVDGVTNGIMFSHLFMGAAASVGDMFNIINRGGFFELGSKYKEYNNFRGDSSLAVPNQDIYEHSIGTVLQFFNSLNRPTELKAALFAFAGQLDLNGVVQKAGRNAIKEPLTATIYGSSMQRAVQTMADSFVEGIYTAIRDAHIGKQGSLTEQQIIDHLRILGVTLFPNQLEKGLMELTLSRGQLTTLHDIFSNTLGDEVIRMFETNFESFMEKRKKFNKAAQLSFNMYSAVLEGMKAEYITELMDNGGLDYYEPVIKGVKQPRVPYNDFTPEQLKELRRRVEHISPIIHSAFSKESDQLSAGMLMAKTGRKMSMSPQYQGVVEFGTNFPDEVSTDALGNERVTKSTKSIVTHGQMTVDENPGVAMVSASIHSSDSHIALTSDPEGNTLNLFDAKGTGVGSIVQTAHDMNTQTWATTMEYSPSREVFNGMMRTIHGIADLIKKGELSTDVASRLVAVMVKEAEQQSTKKKVVNPLSILFGITGDSRKEVYDSEVMTYSTMEVMGYISQYAMEGGAYEVTDANRTQATTKKDAVLKEGSYLTKEDAAAIGVVNDFIKKEYRGTTNSAVTVQDDAVVTSEIAKVGKAKIASTPSLVKLFDSNNEVTAGSVIAALQKETLTSFQQQLLKMVAKVVDLGMTVRMVTTDTKVDTLLDLPTDKDSRAWYVSKGSKHEINVLGTGFVNSVITVETLLHELTHAAIARTVEAARDKTTLPSFKLVQDLDRLLAAANEYAKNNLLATKYAAALQSTQELIAWGMTNEGFQNEVLKKLVFESRTSTNVLLSTNGFKAFIAKITALLFKRGEQSELNNGLEALITNVSGLFARASNTKPSNTGSISLNMVTDPVTGFNTYNTHDIFNALATSTVNGIHVSAEHSSHLSNLLSSIVNKVYGPFGSFKEDIMANRDVTPEAVFLEALSTGKAPYASEAALAGIHFTHQEAYVFDQVEAVMQAAIESNDPSTFSPYRALGKLYKEMSALISPKDFFKGDWATATPADIAAATQTHGFIFGDQQSTNYLARFAAMGMAHEGFNSILDVATHKASKPAVQTIKSRLIAIWTSALDLISGRVTKTYSGQKADAKLNALVVKLATIEAAKQSRMNGTDTSFFNTISDSLDKALVAKRDKYKGTIEAIAELPIFSQSPIGVVKGAAGLVSTYGGYRVRFLMDAFEQFRAANHKTQLGVTAGTLNESRGAKFSNVALHFLNRATKLIETRRHELKTGTAKVVLESFSDAGAYITSAMSAAISQVYMRADLQALTPYFSLSEINELVKSPKKVQTEITLLKQQLSKLPTNKFDRFYIQSAQALGYKLARGKITNAHTYLNVHNMARLAATGKESRVSEEDAVITQGVLDQLTTLYALSYMPTEHLDAIKEVIAKEDARTDGGSGLDVVLKMHTETQNKARELLFSDGEALMMKGYTPEIYDPYMAIIVADDVKGKDLVAQGYRKSLFAVGTDAAEGKVPKQHIYSLRDGGLLSRVTGVFSYKNLSAKGDRLNSGNVNPTSYTGQLNATQLAQVAAAKQIEIDKMFTSTNFDPTKVVATHMAPLYNSYGDVVNYRYMMEESTKDTLLHRDNRFDQLMGQLSGSMYDKVASAEQNTKAVTALHDMYKEDFAKNSDAYLIIGPKSTDPELREIYRMLPQKAKDDILATWGGNGMKVRSDVIDLMFGYRKLSAANIFNADAQNNFVQGMMAEFGKAIFKGKAQLYTRRAEDFIQGGVGLLKANVVVRSYSTIKNNLMSNWVQLMMMGVNPKKLAQNHSVALRATIQHRVDSKALFVAQSQLDNNYLLPGSTVASLKKEVATLTDALEKNPVDKLIKAGLMPTISEDVAIELDQFSYKSQIAKRVEHYTDKINDDVVDVTKWLLMTEDSGSFQAMSFVTQVSDFLARYTLYEHVTTRKNNPLSHSYAVQLAADSFIAYDIPAHRTVQYLNDMGLIMFTKYYIRIQKVIARMLKENPARALMTIATLGVVGEFPSPLQASMFNGGLPGVSGSILGVPGSFESLATYHAAMMPFGGVSNSYMP